MSQLTPPCNKPQRGVSRPPRRWPANSGQDSVNHKQSCQAKLLVRFCLKPASNQMRYQWKSLKVEKYYTNVKHYCLHVSWAPTDIPFCPFKKDFYLSTMDLQCCYPQVYNEVNQLYIYWLFFRFFSHIGHYRVLNRVPCAIYRRFLLISYFIYVCSAMRAQLLGLVRLFATPLNCSLPGSSVCGTSQARMLEWVAISFSRGASQPRDWTWVSCIAESSLFEPPGKPLHIVGS